MEETLAIGRVRKRYQVECGSGIFFLSDRELNTLHSEGLVERIDGWKPEADRHRADALFKWRIPGVSLYQARRIPVRGLSCKVGEYLAKKLRQKEEWADTFLALMQQRIEPPSDQAA